MRKGKRWLLLEWRLPTCSKCRCSAQRDAVGPLSVGGNPMRNFTTLPSRLDKSSLRFVLLLGVILAPGCRPVAVPSAVRATEAAVQVHEAFRHPTQERQPLYQTISRRTVGNP